MNVCSRSSYPLTKLSYTSCLPSHQSPYDGELKLPM
jgi:hypothetical protein